MANARTPALKAATANKLGIGSGSDEDFTYTASDGTEITVPSLALAPHPSRVRLAEALGLGEQVGNAKAFTLLLRAAAGDAYELIAELSDPDCDQFLEAWRDHSGVGLGESKAS